MAKVVRILVRGTAVIVMPHQGPEAELYHEPYCREPLHPHWDHVPVEKTAAEAILDVKSGIIFLFLGWGEIFLHRRICFCLPSYPVTFLISRACHTIGKASVFDYVSHNLATISSIAENLIFAGAKSENSQC